MRRPVGHTVWRSARTPLAAALLAGTIVRGVPASGQVLDPRAISAFGIESRGVRFDSGLGARRIVQWVIPVAMTMKLGERLSADLSAGWAATSLSSYEGWSDRLAGLTDTEVRVSFGLGADLAVVSVAANLPTGLKPGASKIAVLGAAASNFVTFPVSSFGAAPSVTGALAAARNVVGINLGLGVAMRWSSGYQPFADLPDRFEPGATTRVHLSADALLGAGRLGVAASMSTFAQDDFSLTLPGAAIATSYQPGTRALGHVYYAFPLGATTATAYGWHFRNAEPRDSAGAPIGSREAISNIGLRLSVPVARFMAITPALEARQLSRDSVTGRMVSAELGWSGAAGLATRLGVAARYDRGYLNGEFTAIRANLTGWNVVAGVRRAW